MNPHYPSVSERAEHRCEYCRAPESIFNLRFEVEHITPSIQGGLDEMSNLALACRACNVKKGIKQVAVDPQTQSANRLFHPRQDDWNEHFRYDRETGKIEGSSAIGRATINALDLNSPDHVEARRFWLMLGLFP